MLVETIPVPEAVATPVFPGLPVMAPVLCPEDANAQPIVSELTITGGLVMYNRTLFSVDRDKTEHQQ